MNLDTSAKMLNTQTSIGVHECEELIFRESNHTHKKWLNLPSSSHTVTLAEGILQGMMSRGRFYQSYLVSTNSATSVFQVSYSGGDTIPSGSIELDVRAVTDPIDHHINDNEDVCNGIIDENIATISKFFSLDSSFRY